MAEIKIDRDALKAIVSGLRTPLGENEWCIACGAGKGSSKLDFPEELVREAGRQFLDPKALRDVITTVRDIGGEQAWCIACGAGKGASPVDRVLPAEISDEFIDELATKLISAVKVG